MGYIDLKELSQRESERVEWKENVADIEDIVKTAVAFANDYSNLGGGYIVCGARETKDEYGFQKLEEIGLSASRLKEIEGSVLTHLREKVDPPIVPITEEIPINNERRILIFIIPASGRTHSYRASGKESSTFYIRIGRETREAKNGLLRELFILKKELEPWDKRINNKARIEDIDLIYLREYLQEMNVWDSRKAVEDYLSEKERIASFIPPLMGREPLTNELRPRNFTILMFSRNPEKFFDGAYTILSIYRGKDRSEPVAERHEITGTVVQQARRCIELLNAESYVVFDKTDSIPNQLKYPVRALQEAVVNCLVHRDYEINQPARITVFIDRIEIYSPGSLPRAIEYSKFKEGRATPFWRNQSLAYFFNRLQMAQAEGQGIPTIIRTMKEEGCPDPSFEVSNESVTCILPAHPRHILMKELYDIENDVILGKYEMAEVKLADILQKDPYNFRAIILYCDISNLLNKPDNIRKLILDQNIDLTKLNSDAILKIAESISNIKSDQKLAEVASKLIKYARSLALEEKQIERMVITMKKLNRNEELIEFVKESISKNNSLARNVVLLENSARAKMDLAKKCIDTARNIHQFREPSFRAKAWVKARNYLAEAERELTLSLENVSSEVERDYIKRDIAFLNKMKKIAEKPKTQKRHK